MIINIQCIGYRTLSFNSDNINLNDLYDYIKTQLSLPIDSNIVLKYKNHTIDNTSIFCDGMKLVSIISKKSSQNQQPQNQQPQNQPITKKDERKYCLKDCGFYANNTSDYCSRCYSDSTSIGENNEDNNGKNNGKNNEGKNNEKNNEKNDEKSKCLVCQKRLGLLGFLCKCNNKYCGAHRQPEHHTCTFDYKTKNREELKNQLVKCDNTKINKI